MAYPPTLPPANRLNTTPSFDNHPGDHNLIVTALSTILAELGNDPSGSYSDLTARLSALVPIGTINIYGASAAPTGWLVLDGTAVSRTTYALLFGVIGTTYGAGDGTTTFNLPDLRGRFPVGRNPADPLWDVMGEKAGTKDAVVVDHTHTTDIDHDHANVATDTDPGHQHGPGSGTTFFTRTAGGGALGVTPVNVGEQWFNPTLTGLSGAHAHNVNLPALGATPKTSSAASGGVAGTNQNVPPFIALTFIIKALL